MVMETSQRQDGSFCTTTPKIRMEQDTVLQYVQKILMATE